MFKKFAIYSFILTLLFTGCSTQPTPSAQADESSTTITETVAPSSESPADSATIQILNTRYAYGETENLSVDGTTINGIPLGDTGVYYAPIGQALTGTLYGVSPLSYAEYYAAELGAISTQEVQLAPAIEDYQRVGAYDAITSATSLPGSHASDYPTILAYKPGTDLEGDPLKFDGIKAVDIAVDAQTYVEGKLLIAVGANQFALAQAVEKLVLNDDYTQAVYNNNVKTLQKDGLYTEAIQVNTGSDPIDLSSLTMSTEVSYESRYGNYVFRVIFDGFNTEDESDLLYWSNYLNNLYAATIKDTKGQLAGTLYYQDVWVEHGRAVVEIAVSTGHVKASHGYEFDVNRFDEMFVDNTIDLPVGDYQMTLKSRGYQDISATATVGKRLSEEQHIAIESVIWQDAGNELTVDRSQLPSDFTLEGYRLQAGHDELVENVDYTFDEDQLKLTINNTENTGINDYDFTIFNINYQPSEAHFTLKSTMKAEQLTLKDGQLIMASDSPITLQDYVNRLERAYIWDSSKTEDDAKRIRPGRAKLFTEDFKLNAAAEYRKRAVFKSGLTYSIKLTAPGFEDVILSDITIE